jgi:hypothetical protein
MVILEANLKEALEGLFISYGAKHTTIPQNAGEEL